MVYYHFKGVNIDQTLVSVCQLLLSAGLKVNSNMSKRARSVKFHLYDMLERIILLSQPLFYGQMLTCGNPFQILATTLMNRTLG